MKYKKNLNLRNFDAVICIKIFLNKLYYYLVCFSSDGKYVIGVNFEQIIISIDVETLQVISKRKFNEISKLISLGIFQISPNTTVITSLYRESQQQPIEQAKSYINFINGNLLNSDEASIEYHYSLRQDGHFEQDKKIEFKFLYVEKR